MRANKSSFARRLATLPHRRSDASSQQREKAANYSIIANITRLGSNSSNYLPECILVRTPSKKTVEMHKERIPLSLTDAEDLTRLAKIGDSISARLTRQTE